MTITSKILRMAICLPVVRERVIVIPVGQGLPMVPAQLHRVLCKQ